MAYFYEAVEVNICFDGEFITGWSEPFSLHEKVNGDVGINILLSSPSTKYLVSKIGKIGELKVYSGDGCNTEQNTTNLFIKGYYNLLGKSWKLTRECPTVTFSFQMIDDTYNE